jgi:predicted lipoprotein with Yx(FWY)xxD motif
MKIPLALAGIILAATLTACPPAPPPGGGPIVTVGTGSLANSLVAGSASSKSGFALYKFASDTQNGTTSACNGGCATTWPPLTVTSSSGLTAGGGATKALGTITRSDGSLQVTYDGWPLYFYASDTTAGTATGTAIAGWTLVAK